MSRRNRDRFGHCRKRSHPTREQALAAHPGNRAYWCWECSAWHDTTEPLRPTAKALA